MQLQLQGRRCLVVGGGAVGTRRARSLLRAGAVVTIVSPTTTDDLRDMALVGLVALHARPFADADIQPGHAPSDMDRSGIGQDREPIDEPTDLQPTDLQPTDLQPTDLQPTGGVRWSLVVVATDSPEVNERAGELAVAAGIWVNRADDAIAGDIAFPATVDRGPISVAVSSQGRSPVLSRWVAERLDGGLDQVLGLDAAGLDLLAEVLAEARRELRRDEELTEAERSGVTPDPVDWRSALDGSILELINEGRRAEAKERLLACLSS
ncbi:hypothetical protein BH10ACT3_BH10ACT3_02400 [soil metagenome]